MSSDRGYLPVLESREEYFDLLEGFAPSQEEAPPSGALQRRRIKTYMLETSRQSHAPQLQSLFSDAIGLGRVDDTLYRVHDAAHDGKVVGLLEALHDRYPVLYTALLVEESNKWIREAVDGNPWLDRLWLSSPILFELWKYVQRNTPPHRYVRLGFEHEAWYETPSDLEESGERPSDEGDLSDEGEDVPLNWIERRRSRVALTERLALLNTKLKRLMDLYDPLHSLVQLQIPGGERGGHRFYHDGQATNWSDSFLEHRATVGLVVKLYRAVTELAEERLWVDLTQVGEDGYSLTGAPVTIQFREPLSEATFNRFVALGLQRRTSRFRIGGYITRRGPTKVHLAGIDHHLWQPFLLEATNKHLICVLPRGTCGNTIHRLVTNVQRYLDPRVDVWLGSQRYGEAVAESMTAP